MRSACIESLEDRRLLASISVDAGTILRPIDAAMFGTNITWWQGELDTPRMRQMIQDTRLGLLRMPGGSSSNGMHFDAPPPWNGYKTTRTLAQVVESVGAEGMVSVNYGSGSPQEAAAYLAYYNAHVGDPTVIGWGKQWDASTRTWVWKDWKTAGYWAALRAAAPLTTNDGLNHLRANHPAPWGFAYWEVGNENFATWEENEHTYGGTATASGAVTAGNEPGKAFDEDKATKWVGQFSGSATLQYQFFNNEQHVVRHYRIISSADIASHPSRAPKNWTLEASNDGTGWTSLDTRTNQAATSNNAERTYAIASPGAYRYYRMRITALNGTDTLTELAEVRLMYDVVTYVSFAKTFSDLAHQIDPTVKVGLVATLPMQWNLPNQTWTQDMLQESARVGLTPGFLSDHVYVGGQTDENLLLNTVNKPGFGDGWAPENWPDRTAAYRSMLNAYLGASAANVQVMLTEFNSDLGNKQSTNLVSGLWIADAMAGAMQTEYAAAIQWDLTNGYTALSANPSRYGWREGSDNGLISTGSGPAPASGAYVPYPAYFGASLAGMLAQDGRYVLKVTSDDPYLSAYAVRQTDGSVNLLVINKSATTTLTGNFSLAGFNTTGAATVYRYGIAEDTAQSQTIDGAAAFTTYAEQLTLGGTGFSYAFPAYSMTLIRLPQGADAPVVDIYQDALGPGWQNWSWNSTVDFANASPVHDGANAIAVTALAGWSGFSLWNGTPLSTAGHSSIRFWVHGGTGTAKNLRLYTNSEDSAGGSGNYDFTAAPGVWTEIVVPLSAIGNPTQIKRVNIQNRSNDPQTAVYLDNLRLWAEPVSPAASSVSINGGASQRSMLKSVQVAFSKPVTLSSGAVSVLLSSGQVVPGVTTAIANPSGDQQTYVLTFTGTAAIGGSLPDGVYDLKVTAAGVRDGIGNYMTRTFTQRFHRLFGDSKGDKWVNLVDYRALRMTLGRSSGSALFNSAFDHDDNGLVNVVDMSQFRRRFGMRHVY